MIKLLSEFFKKFLVELSEEGLYRIDTVLLNGKVDCTIQSCVFLLDNETGDNKYELAKVIIESFKDDFYNNIGSKLLASPEITETEDAMYYDCYFKTLDKTYRFTVDFTVAYPYLIVRILY